MDPVQAATLLIALSGLVLGLLNSYVQWQTYRRDRADVKVTLTWATPTYNTGYGTQFGETFVAVTATNTGRLPVGINGMAFSVTGGKTIPLTKPEPGHVLPAVLQPGEHRTMWIESEPLKQTLREEGVRLVSAYAHGPSGQRWEQRNLGGIGRLGT